MEDEETFHKITLSIPYDMWEYLQRNPGINRSLIFRDKVNEIRTEEAMKKSFLQFQCQIIFMACVGIVLYFFWPREFFVFLFLIYLVILFWIMLKALFYSIEYNEVVGKWNNRYTKKK